jgi:hypothetical protein
MKTANHQLLSVAITTTAKRIARVLIVTQTGRPGVERGDHPPMTHATNPRMRPTAAISPGSVRNVNSPKV